MVGREEGGRNMEKGNRGKETNIRRKEIKK